MKQYIIKTIFASILASIAFPSFAQESEEKDLSKTIVVEKEFVPVEVKVTKPATSPAEFTQKVAPVNLTYSDWALPTAFDPVMVQQSPIIYKDESLEYNRKRGYFDFAGGNYANIFGRLGYRILDSEKTKLGVWLKHDSSNGNIYKDIDKDVTDDNKKHDKQNYLSEKIGIDFANTFSKGTLNASLVYNFNKFNYVDIVKSFYDKDDQKANNFGLNLGWNNDSKELQYNIGATINYFGFDKDYWVATTDKGAKEFELGLNGGIRQVFGENSYAGVDIAFQYLNQKNLCYQSLLATEEILSGEIVANPHSKSFGMFSITPNYSKATDKMNLRIGARLDISFNNGTTFRIAPDVKFDYKLCDIAAVSLSAVGGNKINTFHNAFDENRYINPSYGLPTTYTLVDATAAIKLGLFKGFYAYPFVGGAVTKHSAVNYIPTSLYQYHILKDMDMNGFKAGLELGYKYGTFVETAVKYTFTPQGLDYGYIYSNDCAEHNVDASIKVTPIKRLNIGLSYQLRAQRTQRYEHRLPDGTSFDRSRNLENISNLNASASYGIFDWLTVFCQANNLLGREYTTYYGFPAQKFNILAGVGLNF